MLDGRRGRRLAFAAVAVASLVSACGGAPGEPPETPAAEAAAPARPAAPSSAPAGALLYVPVYSHVLHQTGEKVMYLTATVNVRNTDLSNAIVVTKADYHDSEGELLEHRVESPIHLAPLASTQFVVAQADTRGGAGACFIIEWFAETLVSDPVVEGVMIGTTGQQGLSFVTQARVLRRSAGVAGPRTE